MVLCGKDIMDMQIVNSFLMHEKAYTIHSSKNVIIVYISISMLLLATLKIKVSLN
jgi:hypothetical protein